MISTILFTFVYGLRTYINKSVFEIFYFFNFDKTFFKKNILLYALKAHINKTLFILR